MKLQYGLDSSAPLRVLVIEADRSAAERTIAKVRAIASLRIEVAHVGSISEARSYLLSRPADLILMDLELPNGRGLESLRAVRRTPSVPPIIVLTDAPSLTDALRAISEEGAQTHIPKDVLTTENIERILLFAVARHEYGLRQAEAQRALYVTEGRREP